MAKKELKEQLKSYEGYVNDIPLVIDPCKQCKIYKEYNGWFMGEFKKGEGEGMKRVLLLPALMLE